MTLSRRRFLEDSLIASSLLVGGPLIASASASTQPKRTRPFGAPIRVGVIGVRGRGRAHIKSFKDSPDSQVVAICDADEGIIGAAMNAAPDAKFYRDVREMLERSDIDAVSIATPNHWHALGAAWALKAGKHVYVEKPMCYDIHEGKYLNELAEKSGLVLQHGTQSRSHKATIDGINWMRDGGLGKINYARALCYKRRESIGKVAGPIAPPSTLDYDLWTGPAALTPLRRTNLHYDWHWDYNTGNGDIGNQGVHQMDIARWGLGKTTLPASVTSCGGRLGYDDDGNTANTQIATYDYGDTQIIFEVRGLRTGGYRDTTIGVIFHCEGGYVASASYSRVVAFDNDGKVVKVFEGGGNHVQTFLDAVKAGSPSAVTASSLDGYVSSSLCHMGNVSYRLGQQQALSADDAPFAGNDAANETFTRYREHLIENGLDASSTNYAMGPKLAFDHSSAKFTGTHAQAANILAGRSQRSGFRFEDFG